MGTDVGRYAVAMLSREAFGIVIGVEPNLRHAAASADCRMTHDGVKNAVCFWTAEHWGE